MNPSLDHSPDDHPDPTPSTASSNPMLDAHRLLLTRLNAQPKPADAYFLDWHLWCEVRRELKRLHLMQHISYEVVSFKPLRFRRLLFGKPLYVFAGPNQFDPKKIYGVTLPTTTLASRQEFSFEQPSFGMESHIGPFTLRMPGDSRFQWGGSRYDY